MPKYIQIINSIRLSLLQRLIQFSDLNSVNLIKTKLILILDLGFSKALCSKLIISILVTFTGQFCKL